MPMSQNSVDYHDLSMNTVAFRPAGSVVAAVARTAAAANEYPDMAATELTAAVARWLDVPGGYLTFGPGSAALCQIALLAWCGPGAEVVHQWPSFEAYPLMIEQVHATAVAVASRDTETDIGDIAAAVTDRTRMVLLCNPNNPTGAVLRQDRIRRLLSLLPEHVTVLVDEAYRDFVLSPGYRDAVELVADDPRVAVLRTFSKSFGLAGLRVGYLIAQPALTAKLAAARMFFAVSAPAQAAAVAAVERVAEMRERCAAVGAERARLRGVLCEQGWAVPLSHANFLWLPTPQATEFASHCAQYGVAVRAWPGRGVRVTVGAPASNDVFAGLAAEFIALPRAVAR